MSRVPTLFAVIAVTSSGAFAQRTDTIVKNVSAPRYAGVATLVEEMTLGSGSAADEYVFGDVSDIAVAKDGSVYILDNTIYAIRMYDAKGKYLRTIGRRGQGPGEIASPSGIGLLPDGRLLLWDTGNWRINVYSATGQSIAHWSMANAGGGTSQTSRGMVVDTGGTVFVKRTLFQRPADGSRPRTEQAVVRVRSADGAVVDTLHEPVWAVTPRAVTSENGPAFMSAPVPFDPIPLWLISPSGQQITGIPNRYAFEIHTSANSVLSVRRDLPAEPISAAQRDSARKAIEEKLKQNNPAYSWNGPEMARTRPFYEGIVAGLDGRIWVTRVKEVSPGVGKMNFGVGIGRGQAPARPVNTDVKEIPSKPALYDVFEPDGAFIGQVRIPPRVSTAVRRGDFVWGVAYDDDDVATVKRYRIVWK